MQDQDRDKMRMFYANLISQYLTQKDPNALIFRTLIDTWYAYWKGGPFLTDAGAARWVNTGDIRKRPELANAISLRSKEAGESIRGGDYNELVKDHAIPVKTLRLRMSQLNDKSIDAVDEYLQVNYRIALLKLRQHTRLSGRKHHNLQDSVDSRTRYASAGIEMEPTPEDIARRRGHLSWGSGDLDHR
jgi:hypothetical protein